MNLRSAWRTGVKLVDCNSKKCFRFPYSPSYHSPQSTLWESLSHSFDESTTLAPNNPSHSFSKSSSNATILISYHLPSQYVKASSYYMSFTVNFFPWHSTIKITNNHVFIILSSPHDITYIGMVFNPFWHFYRGKVHSKGWMLQGFLLLELYTVTLSNEIIFWPQILFPFYPKVKCSTLLQNPLFLLKSLCVCLLL